jgi:hypothetical protein
MVPHLAVGRRTLVQPKLVDIMYTDVTVVQEVDLKG